MATYDTVSYLKVDGTLFPPLSANQQGKNKIWNTDAGRTQTGKFVGQIICLKGKLEVKYNYLTENQIKTISNIVDSKKSFHKVEYYDITKGKKVEMEAYFGDSTYPIYGRDLQGNLCVTGMNLSIIER